MKMHYVYLLRSERAPEQTYIGLTDDLKKRVLRHNQGDGRHSSKWRPWKLVAYQAFADRSRAAEFERYLKTGSGRAFAKRHFW